jgi:epoxyqueuosine reductase
MSKLIENLYAHLEKINCKAKIISTDNLSLLIKEIQEFHTSKLLDDNFFEERLSWIKTNLLENLQEAKSVIVVAVPRPQTKATFIWKGHSRSLLIPPTYTEYEQTREKIEKLLRELLQEKNYSTTRAIFPLKTLAVRSGLGEYGKNNICYVPSLGSFHQLAAVYSSMSTKDTLQKSKMMKACKTCELCQKACPTKAISKNRFLLYAERCLTYHNEKNGKVLFPTWIKKTWHNSVVGCMYCQKVCPVNRDFLNWFGIEEQFSEQETNVLLKTPSPNDLSRNTMVKLRRLNLADYLDSLSRNLGVFFNQ